MGKNFTLERNVLIIIIFMMFITLFATSFLPSIYEEGVYINSLYEMFLNKDFLRSYNLGEIYYRPPFINWVGYILSVLLRSNDATFLLRFSVFCTNVVLGCYIYNFVKKVHNNDTLGMLAVLFLLGGDFLFKRGWIAYSDPMFCLGIFASSYYTYLHVQSNLTKYLFLSYIFILISHLSKSPIAYYYFYSYFVLLIITVGKTSIINLKNICTHTYAVIVILLINNFFVNQINSNVATLNNLNSLFSYEHISSFPFKNLYIIPYFLLLSIFPYSFLAVIQIMKKKNTIIDKKIMFYLGIIAIYSIPVFLSKEVRPRYLLPVYPWIAILSSYIISISKPRIQTIAILLSVLLFFIKSITVVYSYFSFDKIYGSAKDISQNILDITSGNNIYLNDTTSCGQRIAVEINKLSKNYCISTTASYKCPSGYLITRNKQDGDLVAKYILGKDKIFLVKINRQAS